VSQQYIRQGESRAICPNCGTPVQDPADVICVHCRAPLPGMRRRPSLVVLRISFPTGNVDVPAGTSVILGRDPAQSLVAAAFGQYDNVSRRHATIMVDDSGRASIRDEGSTNGTFVNGDRVLPGSEVRLVDGDRIRLAADVTGDVSLPRAEPDPASLSRNGFV
jgi:pSer/pThr/pTyr-binding forkhead associated (FHA) protein